MYFDTHYYIYIGVGCFLFILAVVFTVIYRRRNRSTTVILKQPSVGLPTHAVQLPPVVQYAQPSPVYHYNTPVQAYPTGISAPTAPIIV
jgi:hypothetical protein